MAPAESRETACGVASGGRQAGGWTRRLARRRERDLGRLLAGLDPRPDPEDWVFVAVAGVPAGVAPLMTFREAEALTCIVTRGEARRAGLAEAPVFRRITLGVRLEPRGGRADRGGGGGAD